MARRSVSVQDLFELRSVDDPMVDPVGSQIAFVVTWIEQEDDCYRSSIWVRDFATGDQIRLTSGRYRDSKPAWSPDGSSLAFISDRGDCEDDAGAQIHVIPASGGEPRQLTRHAHGVDAFEWSPDGTRMLFVAGQTTSRPDGNERDSDVRVVTTARFRVDGAGYLDDRYKQIFILNVRSGAIRQLTDGPYDHQHATWAPNGNEIAFVGNRREGWEFSNVRDVYLVKTESAVVRRLTDGDGHWSHPAWSPDGSRLAAYGTRDFKSQSARNEIFTIAIGSGDVRSASAKLDVDFRDSTTSDWNGWGLVKPRWLEDRSVVCVAGVAGQVRPVRVDLEAGELSYLAESGGRYGHPQPLRDGSFVAVRTDFTDPGEVVKIDRSGETEALTDFNRAWRDSVEVAIPEPLDVTSPDGESVAAWLLKPPGLADGQQAPLLLEIHGGPFGMYCDTFMHEFHLLAAQGYGVLFANPRGSAGYGDRFAGLLLPEMGENDLPDLMAAVDRAVAEPWVDAGRLGVLGGSYGGFMTNWAIAHTDRFRAAVTQRTVSDWYSAWGTDDIFYGDENATFGATPWEDPELYYRLSPISYVERMTTPLLIIHSEHDYRCPISQGEELFIALKRLEHEVEFVRVPDESHGLSRSGKPSHRVERLKHILRWFDTQLTSGE